MWNHFLKIDIPRKISQKLVYFNETRNFCKNVLKFVHTSGKSKRQFWKNFDKT